MREQAVLARRSRARWASAVIARNVVELPLSTTSEVYRQSSGAWELQEWCNVYTPTAYQCRAHIQTRNSSFCTKVISHCVTVFLSPLSRALFFWCWLSLLGGNLSTEASDFVIQLPSGDNIATNWVLRSWRGLLSRALRPERHSATQSGRSTRSTFTGHGHKTRDITDTTERWSDRPIPRSPIPLRETSCSWQKFVRRNKSISADRPLHPTSRSSRARSRERTSAWSWPRLPFAVEVRQVFFACEGR